MNIVFDLDDTLYLEKLYIYQGFWQVAQVLGRRFKIDIIAIYLKLLSLLKSGSKRVFDEMLEDMGLQVDGKECVAIYRNSPRRLHLLPDVSENLQFLRDQGHHLILLTNGDSETQWKKVKALNLVPFFDLIVVPADYGKEYWKPSLKSMTIIEKRFTGAKKDFLFIGNGQDDLQFAQHTGIEFIFIKRKHRLKSIDLNTYRGKIIETLFELKEYLKD